MKQIKMGMKWDCDGHMMEVVELVPHVKCRITETWIAEDCGKACKETCDYEISTDENGNEFAHIGDYMLHSGAAINMQEDEITTNKEEKTMTNTNITFTLSGATYESTATGRFFCTPLNGKKTRIGKLAYEAAYNQHMAEVAARGLETQIAIEDENPELGYTGTVGPEVKPEPKTKRAPKPEKKPRTKKVQEGGFEYDNDGTKIILTAKQADFFKHLPDTDFWENGVDSTIWVDSLCDEIGGQFASKPMTVGAMISTICEKGLGSRVVDRRDGRKCTQFALTDLGKKIATALGL
jgi:hypothetical protein